ncbi:molybdenum cofactor guanylyltransferase [Microbulbifer sp. 2205BS26-8]|uniref:molybdenum cofactor guanylyltransferase n=1 Tax=Microbulbifer sp. 2205BS26-8 TaxID=3064386 RepID=UPI00273F8FDC|nr:molybdenum cofactor guanylyltransferase [Microbulbifer sp. 2205BS26-8]MDP5208231.1 molybdenum cofactor guanylyltransferase [Microbulbifer sp. 2205BS26-8]
MAGAVVGQATIGVVLAGGRSRRMGRDKALLAHPECGSFLEHADALLRTLPLAQVVTSGARPGGIEDLVPERGPLGGLYSVALATGADAALVIPVDMPLLRRAHLAELLVEGQHRGCPCYFENCFFPLWLPLNQPCLDYLCRAVAGSAHNSVGALLRHLGAKSISLTNDGEWHRNINTPADYLGLGMPDKISENRFLRDH